MSGDERFVMRCLKGIGHLCLMLFCVAAVASRAVSQEPARDLYLEVFINDVSTGLIGHFVEMADGGLAAAPEELETLGLRGPVALETARLVRLDGLRDVVVSMDEVGQSLFVTASGDARVSRIIDLAGREGGERPVDRSGYGAAISYSLLARGGTNRAGRDGGLEGLSGSFEARLLSPHGVFRQTFVAGYAKGALHGARRLASTWSGSDPRRLLAYDLGDLVTGGLSWTRPVRLAGGQLRRDFGLRPDLVTQPLPAFSGTAAVPSTLDVYVDNTRRFTTLVSEGPFRLVNLPVITGAGSARIVLRDVQGRERSQEMPFYTSAALLRSGLLDFSTSVGFARRGFGDGSSSYDRRPVGLASARYGLTDRLIVEGHVEAGAGLVNGGAGLAFPLGTFGAGSVAMAASSHRAETGFLVNAGAEAAFRGWRLRGVLQRTFGAFHDIASVTARPPTKSLDFNGFGGVPRAVHQLSLGVPLPLDLSSLGISYAHVTSAAGKRNQILGLSYGRRLGKRGSLQASAFVDVDDRKRFGVFASYTRAFGGALSATTGLEQRPDGMRLVTQVAKPEGRADGSFGWRLRSAEGGTADRSIFLTHRGRRGRVEGRVQQYDRDFRVTASLEGAAAVLNGGLFAANRLGDAFAVVDAGGAGIEVRHQNRVVGRTNRRGRLLVPDLIPGDENALSLDPTALPVDAEVSFTRRVVVPAAGAGLAVDFGVAGQSAAALVTFVDAKGRALDVGLSGRLVGSPAEPFMVGYDGAAYVRGLGARNVAEIEREDGRFCKAEFSFHAQPGRQISIGTVPCL